MKDYYESPKIKIISTIIIVGLPIAIIYHYFMGAYIGKGFPWNSFVFMPQWRTNDWYNEFRPLTLTGHQDSENDPLLHQCMNYIYYFPHLFLKTELKAYLFYIGTFLLYFFGYNYIQTKKHYHAKWIDLATFREAFILTIMTWPVLYVLDRGNQEMYMFIFISLAILFYYKKNTILSAILFALVIHIKIYYAIYLLLFISDKKYKEIFITVFLFFVIPKLCLYLDLLVFPKVYFHFSLKAHLLSALSPHNTYNQLMVIGDLGTPYSKSLFTAFKTIMYVCCPQSGSSNVIKLFYLYMPFVLICAVMISLYIIFIEKIVWRKIALITFTMILFPYVTGGYRLLMLYIPMWKFINIKEKSKYNTLYSILFGLLLIPKEYFIISVNISSSVIIDPLLMSIFTLTIMYEGMQKWKVQHNDNLVAILNPFNKKQEINVIK
jgi:hypothetical protein